MKKPWFKNKLVIIPSIVLLVLVVLGAVGAQRAADQAAADQVAASQAAVTKAAVDKAAADKAAAYKAAADKFDAEKAAQEVADKAAADKAAAADAAAEAMAHPIIENSGMDRSWKVGKDVAPGRYQLTVARDGTTLCYYSVMVGESYVDYGLVDGSGSDHGRPTITLKRGQDFTTSDCGTWTKK